MANLKKVSCFGILVFMSIFIFTSIAYATNGIKVIGLGPVQRSMGGVGVGLPLDSATTITNPAGMSEVDGRVDLGITTVIPVSSYEATGSPSAYVTDNGSTIKSGTMPFILPAAGVVVPITDNWTVGLGLYSVSGAGVDYKSNLYGGVTYTCYTASKFTPAISYSFNDAVSLGIGPTFDFATFAYEAAGNPSHNNAYAYGIGFTVGTLIKPLEFFEKDDIPWDLPSDLLSIGFAYESKQWFTRFEYNTSAGKDKLEFDLPQSFTFGIGLKPMKKLKIGFDVGWIDWSDTLGNNKPRYASNSSGSSDFNCNWVDQIVYKVGAEFDVLEDSLVKKLTLRLGYNYGKAPISDDRPFENIALPGIAEHHLTCGAGVKFTEKLGLNVGFMYAPQISIESSNLGSYISDAKTRLAEYAIDLGLFYEF